MADINDLTGAPKGLKRSPHCSRLYGYENLLSEYAAGVQQPPISERLEQIKIFLIDEAIRRDPDFRPKLEECRKYIRDLKLGNQAGEDLNASSVMKLELEIALVDKWIREKENIAEVDFDDTVEYENSKPQGRLMPKTWEPEPGEVDLQVAGLGITEAAGWPTQEPEAKVHVADEDEMQIDPQLSNPVNTDWSFLPDALDPWHYTKAVEQVNRDIAAYAITRYQEPDRTWDENGVEISPFAWNLMPTDFLKPFAPPSADQLLSSWHETFTKLASLIESLNYANMVYPRPLLTAICNTFVQERQEVLIAEQTAVSVPNSALIANRYLCVKDLNMQEYEDLKLFTYQAKYQRIDARQTAFQGSELTFVQAVEALRDNYHDFWPQEGNVILPASEIIKKTREISTQPQKPILSDERREQILWLMGDDNRIRTFMMTNEQGHPTGILGVGRPFPDDFPEVRRDLTQDIDHWVRIAGRILYAYRTLNRNLQAANMDPFYMRDTVLPDFSANLRARIRNWEAKVGYKPLADKWIDLARPLANWREKEGLTVEHARGLLIQRLIDEGNTAREHGPGNGGSGFGERRGGGSNGPSPKVVWNWAENRWYLECGTRFHHRRWDHEVQNGGQDLRELQGLEEAAQGRSDANRGLKSVKFDQRDYVELEFPSPPEPAADNWYPGDGAFFPYAETAQVDAVMQDAFSENVPRGSREDALEIRRAEEKARRKRKHEADINTARNAPRPENNDPSRPDSRARGPRVKKRKTNTRQAAPTAPEKRSFVWDDDTPANDSPRVMGKVEQWIFPGPLVHPPES